MVNFEADNAVLDGFTIDTDGGDRAIAPRDSDGAVIANSKIVNSYRGVQGDYHGRPTNLEVRNTVFETDYGIAGTEDVTGLVVEDNTFHTTEEAIGLGEGVEIESITGNEFLGTGDHVRDYREPANSSQIASIAEDNEFDRIVRVLKLPDDFESPGELTAPLLTADIQTAIDAAGENDIVYAGPGTYEGDITIDTDGVGVVAPGGPNETTIEGMVNFEADNAGLGGFTVDTNGGDRAIAPRDSNGTMIVNNKIVNAYRGVQGDYHGRPTNLVIHSTVFETDYGIAGTEDVTGLVVEDNTFHTTKEAIGLGEGVEIESITGNEFLGTGDHVRDYRDLEEYDELGELPDQNEFDRIVGVLEGPGELAAPLLTADIQTAIDSAGENDIVYVGPGTYEGDITIDTDGVGVVADGPNETTIEGMVNFEADNAVLDGFTIDTDGGDRAIAPRDSDGTVIANSKIVNSYRGVQGDYHGRPTNLEIRDTVFETDYGLAGTEDATGLVVEDNIFHTAEEGIGLGEGVEIESITGNEFLGTGDHVRDYRDLKEYDELRDLPGQNEFDKLVGVFDEDDDILAAPLLTTSIQTAVDEADTGETVYVGNGTYEEQVVINENLSVIGEPGATVQAPPQEERTVFEIPEVDGDDDPRTIDAVVFAYGGDSEEGVVDGDETIDVTISGLEIDGMERESSASDTYFGVGLRNVDGSVEHNVIDGMTTGAHPTGGIGVHGDSDVDVIGNEVHQYERIGIVAVGNYTEGPHPTATIANNYVAGPGEPVDGWAPNGIQIGWGASGEIIDNTVTGNTHESAEPGAIIAAGSEDVLIYNNSVYENHDGIQVYGDAWWGSGLEAENITIINNTVTSSVNGVSIGPDSNDVFVSNNEISENDLGVELWGGVDPTEIELIRNDIVGNDIGVLNPTEEPLVASLNYWGEAEGGAGGPQAVENNSVEGNVVYDPFLTVSIDELEEEDVWTTQQFANDLHIPNDGNTYAVGFPGPTDQTVGEAFSSFTGTIWAYDADDGWSQASNDDDIDALDAFVVVLDDDEADAVVAVEYAEGDATGLPESTTIRPGFNLLPSAALGDATTGFNGPDSSEVLYGLYEFPHGQPLDTQGVDEPHGVIATSEDDFADVTVTPFGGYLMFTGEERSITTFVEAGVTASEIDSRLDRED